MSRTISGDIKLGIRSVDEVYRTFSMIMTQNGYENKLVNGENVWSKGDGIIEPRQCFSIIFSENSVVIQGWLQTPGGERDLYSGGILGIIPKKEMRGVFEAVIKAMA